MTKSEFIKNCHENFGLSSMRVDKIFKDLNIKPCVIFNPKCNKRTLSYKQEDLDKVIEICKQLKNQLKEEHDNFMENYKELNINSVRGKYKKYLIQRNNKIYCPKEKYDEIQSYLNLPYNEKCKLNINSNMNIEKYDDEFTVNCRHFIESIINSKFNSKEIIEILNNISVEFRVLENIHHRGTFVFIKECDSEKLKEYMLLSPRDKSKRTLLEKYGVDNPLSVPEFMEKYKKTCLERYGDENVNNTEEIRNKIRETNMNRYGVEYIPQVKDFIKKTKDTNLKKYGEEWYTRTEEYKDKSKQTNIEKYGVENHSQTLEFKETIKEIWENKTDYEIQEINDKKKKTKLERYGDENYSNTEKMQQTKLERYGNKGYHNYEQMQNTNLEKYGVKCVFELEEVRNKSKQTLLERYGVDNPLANEEFLNKFKETSLKNWGYDNPNKSNEVIEKIRNTRLEKYGSLTIGVRVYKYNDVKFDSSTELYYYIYNHDILKNDITRGKHFEYYIDDVKHIYKCDFLVNGENVEIKGNHLINENMELIDFFGDKHINKEKTQCMRDNNVRLILSNSDEMNEIINIVTETYPNLDIEDFKIFKSDNDETDLEQYSDYFQDSILEMI